MYQRTPPQLEFLLGLYGYASRSEHSLRAKSVKPFPLILAAAREIHPIRKPKDLVRRIRFLLDGLRCRDLIRALLTAGAKGGLGGTLAARPRTIGIVSWPYINKDWSAAQRFDVVQTHYEEVDGIHWLQMAVSDAVVVAELGDVFRGLRLVIDRPEWFLREGELALNLFVEDVRVYTLAFSLGRRSGRRVAFVGGLQGRNLDDVEVLYRDLTKKLHGARPRDFLISAFQMVGEAANVERILCVSESFRHHRHPYFGALIDKSHSASYDAIWADRDGVPVEDGFFELPTRLTLRPEHEIPTGKRAMYRRRYALYERMRRVILQLPHGSVTVGLHTSPAPET